MWKKNVSVVNAFIRRKSKSVKEAVFFQGGDICFPLIHCTLYYDRLVGTVYEHASSGNFAWCRVF